MSNRELIALGTASQVPTRKRNHNGYFLRWDSEGLLFDPGEGIQRQMIYAGVSAKDITKIFITHFHGDHCLGLPGILQRLSLDRVGHPVQIYFPASGRRYFDNLQDASIYYKTATINPIMIEQEGLIFKNENLTIHTKKLDHSVDSWGYRIQEKDRISMDMKKLEQLGISGSSIGELKTKGKLQHEGDSVTLESVSTIKKGQSFAFIMDTRLCDSAISLAMDAEIVLAESTFLDQQQTEATQHGHMTATDAAHLASRAKAKFLILTHFSQRYADENEFQVEASKIFNPVIALHDGDRVDLRRKIFIDKDGLQRKKRI